MSKSDPLDTPVPPEGWLSKFCLIDDATQRVAVERMIEWIGKNDDEFLAWRTGELSASDLAVMNRAFAAALLYLHLDWQNFERPVLSLELLISAFGVGGLDAMWIGDGNLPPSVAGAGASADESAGLTYAWQQRLNGYVCALFQEGWLSLASPLARRYLVV